MTREESQTGESALEMAGGSIPGVDSAAFTLFKPARNEIPVLVAAPHGGRAYPAELVARMREPELAALRLEDRHVDILAREISRQTGATLLVAHAPRAMLDLNRAPDDVDWGMISGGKPRRAPHSLSNRRARSGLGLVPRRLSGLGEIWKDPLARSELEQRIEAIHRPYHRALALAMEEIRDHWGTALLLDVHSMPPLRKQSAQDKPAEFVIGDRFGASCDASLSATAYNHLLLGGRAVAHNRPYSGGYILERHSMPSRGLHAIQLEICRSSYLDARLEKPGPRLAGVARLIAGLVRALAAEVAVLGGGAAIPQAAE